MLFRRPPLLTQCVDLDVGLYYAAVQNLVYRSGNFPQTTADTLCPTCAESSYMSTQLPAGLQCDLIQMAKLQQEMQDAWDNLSQDDIWHLTTWFLVMEVRLQ